MNGERSRRGWMIGGVMLIGWFQVGVDVRVWGVCPDCNANGVEDCCEVYETIDCSGVSCNPGCDGPASCWTTICEGAVVALTDPISPLDFSSPVPEVTFYDLPLAIHDYYNPANPPDVIFTFTANGDLEDPKELVSVLINGSGEGNVFESTGQACGTMSIDDTLTLSAGAFNALREPDGTVTVTMLTSGLVGPCSGSYISVRIDYRSATDCNGLGNVDACEPNTDGDNWIDGCDNCPLHLQINQLDTDVDGVGDACDPCVGFPNVDSDYDDVCNAQDPCSGFPNVDTDGDGVCDSGDICTGFPNVDADGDGVCDSGDICTGFPNVDADADGVCDSGDICTGFPNVDSDGDGVCDASDPCYGFPNSDPDMDQICDVNDNCPNAANPGQEDCDNNGVGNACPPPGAVRGEGSRYLAVTPSLGPNGSSGTCQKLYVTACGGIQGWVAAPVGPYRVSQVVTSVSQGACFTPANWCTVHVTGTKVVPQRTYTFYTANSSGGGLQGLGSAMTWKWCDVNGDGYVDISDILFESSCWSGNFEDATRYGCDVRGCAPDGSINLDDILAVNSAFGGQQFTYYCPAPTCIVRPPVFEGGADE